MQEMFQKAEGEDNLIKEIYDKLMAPYDPFVPDTETGIRKIETGDHEGTCQLYCSVIVFR